MLRTMSAVSILTSLFVAAAVTSYAQSSLVTCTAKQAQYCATLGCREDTTLYETRYLVKLDEETVVSLANRGGAYTKQYGTRWVDDVTKYPIVRITRSTTGETVITAATPVGAAAFDTLLIGEHTYITVNSSAGLEPRALIQMGSCTGLRAPK